MALRREGAAPHTVRPRGLKAFGIIFETLVARDLRTYAESLDGSVSHYKDKSGLECDAVIHLRNILMVVTAQGEFAYERPGDGVIVCPIGALKP